MSYLRKIKPTRKTSMQFAQWDITSSCNLRCKHCRAWKLPREEDLTTKEGIDLLDQLYQLKIQILNFSGGEPFLRRDILYLLEYAKNFPSLTITTNGTLLEKEQIKKLKRFRNLRFSISLDGLEKFHDDFRQVPGTFKKALKAIEDLTTELIPVSIKFTITTSNYKEAPKVFRLISQYKVESFNIRAVIPFGRAENSLTISPKQYKLTVEELLKTNEKIPIISGDPILLPLYPELLGKIWREMGEKVYSEICAGCLAGDEILYIKPNGDVGVCAYIPEIVGNIRKTSLVKLINNSPLFQKLNNWRCKLEGKCGKCKYKYVCGGCRAVALIKNNNNIIAEDPRCLI